MSSAGYFPLHSGEKESVYTPGSIQPHGYLISFSSDWVINHLSDNISRLVQREAAKLLGQTADSLCSSRELHILRNKLQNLVHPGATSHCRALPLFTPQDLLDITVHRSGSSIVAELEHSGAYDAEVSSLVLLLAKRLEARNDPLALCRDASRHVAALTGFDRVMVYRFDERGAGEVIAETLKPGFDSYLGLRYPAADIPEQVRILSKKNTLRFIPHVHYTPSKILSIPDPYEEPLDLSYSFLRSASSFHLEYLSSLAVKAALSISLMRGGSLWGLITCHHYSPRYLELDVRIALELYGKLFCLQLDKRLREESSQRAALAARVAEDFLAKNFDDGDAKSELKLSHLDSHLLELVSADGAVLAVEDTLQFSGVTPSRLGIAELLRFLKERPAHTIFSSAELHTHLPSSDAWTPRIAGVLAIPISSMRGDYLLFFRQEEVQNAMWVGNSAKVVSIAPTDPKFSVRRSFESWKEEVKGKSRIWGAHELKIAEILRAAFIEAMLKVTGAAHLQQKRLVERQELLISELNHRIRNILALIKGVVTHAEYHLLSSEDALKTIRGRIQALARAHDQITRQNWGAASLLTLLKTEFEPYVTSPANQIALPAEDFLLSPEAFSSFTLVVHELVTNSAKYGALSTPKGRLELSWERSEKFFCITWQEKDGPPVTPPTRKGFGTTIIERSIPHDLQGEVCAEYQPEGLVISFKIPLIFISPVHAPDTLLSDVSHDAHAPEPLSLDGPVLLLEDNLIIAMDAEQLLEQLGATKVISVSSVAHALECIEQHEITFALLDINLGSEDCMPVARMLTTRKIPFIFATGYGAQESRDPAYAKTPLIRKPYIKEDIVSALHALTF